MLARGLAIAALVAACFRPSVHPGAPCSPDGSCPNGLECRGDVCVAPGDEDAGADTATDATVDAAIDAGTGSWSAPVPVPGVDSTDVEDDPSFTANRLKMVFTSTRAGGLGLEDIYIGTRATTADPFTVAPLTALNSSAAEQSPEISADGKTLYFTSTRSGANVVYASKLAGGAWSPPAAVPELAAINGDDVAISPDGLTVLGIEFTSTGNLIVMAYRASTAVPFGPLAEVKELEVTTDLAAPTLTNGGMTVYFHAGSPRDLYRSTLVNGHYTTPAQVTELNTAGRDAAPFVSATDDHLMFNRDGELYETSR